MPFRSTVAVLALLLVSTAQADVRGGPENDRGAGDVTLWLQALDPPATTLAVGDEAPAFSYLGDDGAWHRFSDVNARGPVLLLFGAREDELLAVEKQRALFHDVGILPVAVLDRRVSAAGAVSRRLGITSTVLADPKCAIADLYNSLNPLNHRHAQSFFVLDGRGTIRAMSHGALPSALDLVVLSARGLGLPLPESVWSAVIG